MINYYTRVNVNDSFSKDVLLTMFFEWLNNTKRNKMKGLHYQNESSFVYQVGRKKLKIEDFKKHNILGIQFITSENNRNAQFTTEIMYDYVNQTLDLGFYKGMMADSKYFPSLSLPKIFIELLNSDYVLLDNDLRIQEEIIKMSAKEFDALLQQEHQLPIVVLTKNKVCIARPYVVAQRLFGLAHVICVPTNQNPTMKLYYPNKDVVTFEEYADSQIINVCYDYCLEYSIQEYTQNYTFDELFKVNMQEECASVEEMDNLYLAEQKSIENDINELMDMLKPLEEEYESLSKENEQLRNRVNGLKKETLLFTKDRYEEKKEIVLKIMKWAKDTHDPDFINERDIYRRTDVLESILEEM